MNLLTKTFTAAGTFVGTQVSVLNKKSGVKPKTLAIKFDITAGTGGTSVDVYVQTSFDGGTTWVDIANFHVTTSALHKVVNLSQATPVTTPATPTDGSLSANTVVDGVIGEYIRSKAVSVGTYSAGAAASVAVSAGY